VKLTERNHFTGQEYANSSSSMSIPLRPTRPVRLFRCSMAAPHLLADFTAIRQNLVTISGTLEIYYKNLVLTESNIIKIGSNYVLS
jgi:hypothetical protein